MITLTIKAANVGIAARAAEARGVTAHTFREVEGHPFWIQATVGGFDSVSIHNVMRWFNEPTGRAPFSDGTLLLFTQTRDEVQADRWADESGAPADQLMCDQPNYPGEPAHDEIADDRTTSPADRIF